LNTNRSPKPKQPHILFSLEYMNIMKQATLRSIPLAVALVGSFGLQQAAQAQAVTVYGAIGLDVIYATGVAKTGGGSGTRLGIDDNAIVNSRVGIKGGEDLGGGLKAEFDLESSLAPDTGKAGNSAGTFWNRNAFVGLSSGMGTLRIGHQWNPADDYMCGYFVCGFYAPFQFSEFYALSDYYDNTIKYSSPKIGGFEGGVSYTLGEQPGKNSAGQKFQAAVNYGSGPFGFGAVVFSQKSATLPGTDTMYALGASYDLGVAKLRLGVATADVKIAKDDKGTVLDLGVDVPVSATTTVSADYVSKDMDNSADVSFVRLRGTYALSKRTSLNANFIVLKNADNGTFAFSGGATEAGKGQNLLSVGITHSF
jgi:predicted porin